jgi:hypothetical protein
MSSTRAIRASAGCSATRAPSKHMSFPSGPFILEEERAMYGAEPYANGMEETRVVIETFIRYAYEQQYIDRILKLEEIYPPNTYKL